MDTNSANYKAGVAKGTTEEKSKQAIETAQNAAKSVQESAQGAGKQVHAKGVEAVDAVKNATGMNK